MNFITIVLLLAVIYYLFINSHQTEKLTVGEGGENIYTDLICVQENPNDPKSTKHILKIRPNKNGNYTYHKTLHPDRLSRTDGTQYVNYDDLVDVGKNVPCQEGDFSTYLTKTGLPDSESKARKLFNKINGSRTNNNKSSWQQQECTVGDLMNTNHWCNKVHDSITKNINIFCPEDNQNGKPKAKLLGNANCTSFKDDKIGLNAFSKLKMAAQTSSLPQINFYDKEAKPCVQSALAAVGSTPQEVMLDNGQYSCLKDNYGKPIDPTGAMCYNLDPTKNIKPYAPNINGNVIKCNVGDTLQSTVCKNASGVNVAPDLTNPSIPNCKGKGEEINICDGTGLFDGVITKPLNNPLFGTIPFKSRGNDTKCTNASILSGTLPKGGKRGGFCVRNPTSDESSYLKTGYKLDNNNVIWFDNLQSKFAACAT